jgi:hypothetical protein
MFSRVLIKIFQDYDNYDNYRRTGRLFVFTKARGNGILLEGLKKTKIHAYQGSRSVGPEI